MKTLKNYKIAICFAFLLCISNISAQNADSLAFFRKQQVEVFMDKMKELGYFVDVINTLPSSYLFSSIDTNQYYYSPSEISSKEIYNHTKDSLFNLAIDPSIFALSIDPLSEKYPSTSPYLAMNSNPINYIDPDGRDIILTIWATAFGGNGHAGIAISDYHTVENTNLPTGTYTYYDNWPAQNVRLTRIKDVFRTVPAYRSVVTIQNETDFTEENLTKKYPYDGGTWECINVDIATIENPYQIKRLCNMLQAPWGIPLEYTKQDGVLRIHTDYETDQRIKKKFEELNKNKPTYRASDFNCSTYVAIGMAEVLSTVPGRESILGPIKTVTPNKLWRDVLKLTEKEGLQTEVILDPGDKVNKSFKEGKNEN